MPENIGASGAPFNTRIPRIDENADIQTALRLYHYGSDTNNPEPIAEESIAGHLYALEQEKLSLDPSLLVSEDLNDIVTSGYYSQPVAANAIGNSYPVEYAGILKVVNDGGIVSQEYHVIGDLGNIINKTYWRVKYSGSWSSWNGFITADDADAAAAAHAYAKEDTYTRSEMAANFAPIRFTENLKTENHTLALADVNRVVAMNVSGGGNLTVPPSSSVAFTAGDVINIYNSSADILTVVAGAGVTVRNIGTLEQYKEASLRYRGNNEWVAAGPLY